MISTNKNRREIILVSDNHLLTVFFYCIRYWSGHIICSVNNNNNSNTPSINLYYNILTSICPLTNLYKE